MNEKYPADEDPILQWLHGQERQESLTQKLNEYAERMARDGWHRIDILSELARVANHPKELMQEPNQGDGGGNQGVAESTKIALAELVILWVSTVGTDKAPTKAGACKLVGISPNTARKGLKKLWANWKNEQFDARQYFTTQYPGFIGNHPEYAKRFS